MRPVIYVDYTKRVRVLGGFLPVDIEVERGSDCVTLGVGTELSVLDPTEARAVRKALKQAIKVAEAN